MKKKTLLLFCIFSFVLFSEYISEQEYYLYNINTQLAIPKLPIPPIVPNNGKPTPMPPQPKPNPLRK